MDKRTFDALCRHEFSVFFKRAWREMEPSEYSHNWHIDCLCDYLQNVYDGGTKRLIINVPPRTAKTLLVNIAFTAWLLGKQPEVKVIGISYAQRLSEKIAYKCRLLMETQWYRSLFPDTCLDPNQSQKASFLTTKGGGRFSTSVGGTLTGEGANYLIIDDPMNPDEALSDVRRMNANEWIDQAIYSRLNNPKEDRIVVIMQRLHDDDTTGHLLKNGNWQLVKMPAITNNPLRFKPRQYEYMYDSLLHEDRLPKEILDELQLSMGSYAFAGQYLQEPVPLGGGEFKSDFLNYFNSDTLNVTTCNLYITVDPATSKKKTSDYTAMVVWALAPDHNYYVVDGVRERLNPTERIERLFELHRKWNKKSGKPPRVGYERYGMMSDTHYIEQKQAHESYRFGLKEIHSGMQKEERIRRLIPIMEQQRIWLPNNLFFKNSKGLQENLMNVIVEQEILLFPYATHDDFLDAMAMIMDMQPIFPSLNSVEVHSGLDWGTQEVSVLDL